jgi:DNA-binding response OmpR family regulator
MPSLDEVLPPEGHGIADKVMPPRHSLTRVLVLDDELSACKLLSILLGPPDYYCAMASNDEQALVTLEREPFDAVISDLQMSGMELLAEVRRRHFPVAFLVSTGVDDVGVQAMRSGADDYLVKPPALAATRFSASRH